MKITNKKKHTSNILGKIKQIESEARTSGLHTVTITEEQISKKLNKLNSPMITFQSWNDTSSPGTVNYRVGFYNPDPVPYSSLFAHVFVGIGNILDLPHAALAVDSRFPCLTQPDFWGFTIAPSGHSDLQFTIPIPVDIPKSNYIGNVIMFDANWFDKSDYIDRGTFIFEVK